MLGIEKDSGAVVSASNRIEMGGLGIFSPLTWEIGVGKVAVLCCDGGGIAIVSREAKKRRIWLNL
jgi:hypothetical protein